MEKKPLSPFQAGLLIGIVLIIIGLVSYLAGLYTQQWIGYATYLLLCIMVIIAVMSYAKSKDGYVTFGNAFLWGFKTTAVLTVLYVVYLLIFIIVFPDFKAKMIEITREGMEKQNLQDDQIETAMNMMDKAFYVFMFLGTIFFFLLLGVIGSLLGAAFAKKKPVTPFDQRTT
jgi:uncharacterized membrane protein YdjX (TVP38/TMEM64 family)